MKLSLRNFALGAALVTAGAICAQAAPPLYAAKTTDRGQFVYDLNQVHVTDNEYTFSFKSTGDAAKAVLLLKVQGSDVVVPVDLGEVKKGNNSFTVDLTDYSPSRTATCTWSIELHNYAIPADKVTTAVSVGGNRAGVVCMVDPTNEFYGYTVIARTKNGGFDVYDQTGTKIKSAIHANNAAMGGTAANTSSPMRGVQRGTTAQFASWGDAANGVVALDLANLDAAPYGVFEGTNNGKGKITYGNNAVGSGTPTVAYAGEGENTILFTFDEDIFGNQLAANHIGTAMTTNKAAESWGFKSEMVNTNVGLVGTKDGLFFSQVRANGMEFGTPGLAYISLATKEIEWRSSMEPAGFLPSATGGLDINPAGDLLAVATYNSIIVYKLSWNEGKPVLKPYKTIASTNQASNYSAVKFDAGNNLHVINQTKGYYQVIMGQEEGITTTPALDSYTIDITVPEPAPLYIAGEQMGWNVGANAAKFDYDYAKKCYVYTGFKGDDFKITTDASDWGPFDENALWPTNGTLALEPNEAYAISKQFKDQTNLTAPEGEYTIEVSRDLSTLTIVGEEKFVKRDIYIVGDINSWTLPGKLFEFDGTNYVCSDFTGGSFKLAIGEFTEWDNNGFNANTIYPTDDVLSLEPNEAYRIKAMTVAGAPNITVPEGNYSILISKNLKTITISGEEKFVAKQLYLIGEFNDWTVPGVPFTYDAEPVNDQVVYTVNVDQLNGEFLIAGEGYKPKYGGANFDNAGTNYLSLGGTNNNLSTALTDVTLTFTLPVDRAKKPMLTIASDNAYCLDSRKPYAYAVTAKSKEYGIYTVTYKATAPSDEAEVVLTDKDGNQIFKPIGAAVGGINTADVDLKDLNVGKYTWGVSLKGNSEGSDPQKVFEASLPNDPSCYIGLTIISDPESEAYGYTVIGMAGQRGYLVYDPNGTQLYGGPIHADWQAKTFDTSDGNKAGNSIYGSSYMGYAVFSNWNDKAAGLWAVNPLDPTEEPYNMYASEGATMAASGLWTLNGKEIGGGATGLAFAKLGAETFLVHYDEDLTLGKNKVHTRFFNTGDKYITVAPTATPIDVYPSIDFAGCAASDKGFFVTIARSSITDKGNLSNLRYYNFNNELLYDGGVDGIPYNSCAAIACNADGTLIAIPEWNVGKTHVYSVEYTESTPAAVRAANGGVAKVVASAAKPKLTPIATIATGNVRNSRPDMAFDAANNLHIADRITQKYQVYTMPGESKSFTAAPSNIMLELQTGIEDVVADAVEEAEAEYYTLQGIRVAADNLTPGVYVRRQGNTATKVLIK